jgi:hypothetical protein
MAARAESITAREPLGVKHEMLTGQLPLGRFELPSRNLRLRFDEVALRAAGRSVATSRQRGRPTQSIAATPRPVDPPLGLATTTRTRLRAWLPPPRFWRAVASRLGLQRLRVTPELILFTWAVVMLPFARQAFGWGAVGLSLFGALATGWLALFTHALTQRNARLRESLGERTRRERFLRGTGFAMFAAAGVLCAGAALEAFWNRGVDHYIGTARYARERVTTWNEERAFELLRQLPERAADAASLPSRQRTARSLPIPASDGSAA